ncbi:Protein DETOXIFICATION 27 [Glycine max]|nr:Protein DETOXIFICATION 27 [Glycine max]
MPSKEDSPLVEAKLPLLEAHPLTDEREQDQSFPRRFWLESKRLWHIVGPSIFSRIASYSMLVITQAFAGHLGDLELAAISIANNVVVGFDFGLLLMIPLAFFAATGVRVANELGAGNGKGAKFATMVSVVTSVIIGLFFWMLILILHDKFGYIFSNSKAVLDEVNNLSLLLAFTILLNSVQPVLSGVAVGSGWQSYVAYINLGCYYIIGVPLGILMGWVFNQGVMGIWAGMIFGGTATQTLILSLITIRCDWDKEAERAKLHLTKWTDPKQELN